VAQGVGFAVPINTARDSVEELITTGKVVHGFIGVKMSTYGIDEIAALSGLSIDELQSRYGLPANGALVSEVTSGGPADEAGISGGGEGEEVEGVPGVPVEGDVITAVEGERITASDDVIEVVNARDPGDSISMTVVTPNEGEREVELTVDQRPEGT
jgi:S1-C subfamily serine protease